MRKILYLVLSLMVPALCLQARTYVPITFTHEGLTVQARLTLPASAAPYRVIVITPGSGANDKDGTLPMYGANVTCLYPGLYGDTLRSYKGLSDALADSGYAVLTYDKLEYTYTTGMGTITYRKLWLPVTSALRYLKTRADIDTGNMVLLGHSEGSTLIPYIARSHPEVKALISLAGPRRSIYDTVLSYQLRYITATCGGDTAMARLQGEQLMDYFSMIRSGGWNAATPPFAGISAAVWSDYVKVSDSVVINYNLAARRTLFVGLGDDMNVPVNTELERFRREVTTAADFYVLPGLNHYLTTATNPATSKVLTDTLIYWLRLNVAGVSVPAIPTAARQLFTLTKNAGTYTLQCNQGQLRRIGLYSTDGRTVLKSQVSGNKYQFPVDGLAPGLYLLSVEGNRSAEVLKLQL